MSSAVKTAAVLCVISAVLLFASTVTPWMMYSDFIMINGVATSFGVGPFVAGASTGSFSSPPLQYFASPVWWADLTSDRVCAPLTSVFLNWAAPNALCDSQRKLHVPGLLQAVQACMILSLLFSVGAAAFGFYFLKRRQAGIGASVCSFFAMIFAMCTFSIWAALPMAQQLRSESGDFIPLYAVNSLGVGGGADIFVAASPSPVRMYYGWAFGTTILSFLFLLFSTCIFTALSKQSNDEGEFGAGKSGV